MIHVGIDASAWDNERGFGRFTRSLVAALAGRDRGFRYTLLFGTPPERPRGNFFLDHLFGADIRIVRTREARDPAMEAAALEVSNAGGTPFVIPTGASTPLGACGMARVCNRTRRV